MPEVLDKLDTQIADAEKKARDAEAEAKTKRDQLTGEGTDIPEPGTEDFKAATDELATFYKTVDEQRDVAAQLKSQRVVIARTLGDPAEPDPGGERKGIDADQLAEYLAEAKGLRPEGKSAPQMGTRIVESPEYKALVDSGELKMESAALGSRMLGKAMTRTEFKDLVSGVTVAPFKDPRRMEFEPLRRRQVRILDLLQAIPTDQESVKYAQMTVATDNVAIIDDPSTAADIGSGPEGEEVTAAQAGLKPDAAYTFVPKTAEVETIAHGLPIHKNTLADVPQLEAILNEEMIRGLYLFLETEVISGNGSAGHLLGILNQSGIVNQPIGGDTLIVALHKALTACRLLFEEPEIAVLHPTDWQTIRLMRAGGSTTTDGDFLFGPPSQAGDATLWGLPVMTTPVIPVGKPLIGDFSAAQLYIREGVSMLASDSHKDFFMRNMIQLLAEMRAGLGVRRPGAFAKVTV